MKSSKGILTGDRPINSAAILSSDWAVSFGEIGNYEFICASAIRRLSLDSKFVRNNAFVVHYDREQMIVNLVNSPEEGFSQMIAHELFLRMLQEIKSVEPDELETKVLRQKSTSQLVNKENLDFQLPFPLRIKEYKNINLDNDHIIAGSFYGYDKNRFIENKVNTNRNAKDLEKILKKTFEKTRLSIEKNKDENLLQLLSSTSVLSLLFDLSSGRMMNGIIGRWGILGFDKNSYIKHFDNGKNGVSPYSYLKDIKIWEANIRFFPINMLRRKTLIIFNDSICKDITLHSTNARDLLTKLAIELDSIMGEEELLENKSVTILQWLANYKLFELEKDKTLLIIRKKDDNRNITNESKILNKITSSIKIKDIPKIQNI